jgi:hypothetical protein
MGIGGKAIFAAVVIFAFCASAAHSQPRAVTDDSLAAPHGFTLAGTRNYLGLNVGRGLATNCAPTSLFCESHDRSAQMFAGTMFDRHWGAEMDFMDTGRYFGPAGGMRAQGLSVNLVGRTRLLPSLGVYGKIGTAAGRSDFSSGGVGFAFGGGVSWDFSPRLSARFEWDSYDFRLAEGPVRSTRLGLQYRY